MQSALFGRTGMQLLMLGLWLPRSKVGLWHAAIVGRVLRKLKPADSRRYQGADAASLAA